jgi:putative intracellular protease/amidase
LLAKPALAGHIDRETFSNSVWRAFGWAIPSRRTSGFPQRNIQPPDEFRLHKDGQKEFAFIDGNGYYIRMAEPAGANRIKPFFMDVAVLLFDEFETLDVFGPVEILGRLKDHFSVNYYSQNGALVTNNHGIRILTEPLGSISGGADILLIPGGPGTRRAVDNNLLIDAIRQIAVGSRYVLTVCTGSAILAATGLLDGRKATSNKRAFSWVAGTREEVNWVRKARWIVDGKFYTSGGVSAGMDMALGFLADLYGDPFARKVAFQIEYNWVHDKDDDAFFDQEQIPVN